MYKVILEGEHFHGHIQDINDRDHTAVVFIEEIGEKRTVLISCLKTPPSSRYSCLSHGRYHRRKQDMSASLASTQNYYRNTATRYSSYSYRSPVDINTANSNNNSSNSISCNTSQGYTLARAYSYPETAMTNTSSNYVPMETMDISATQNVQQNSKANLNQLSPPALLQRYGPPAIRHPNALQQNAYMYGSMVQQTNPAYSCVCVPYLENISVTNVNMNCLPSQDMSGKDLPEVNTLRFFFNLGVENYRLFCQSGQIWPPMEMTPVMSQGNGAITADQLNGNLCGQACSTYPTSMQYPVYYTGPGPYAGAQGFMPVPNTAPGQGSYPAVNHHAQAYSMPPQVTQIPAVQTAQ